MMKRTATTLMLLAGLGGAGCVSPTSNAPKQPQQGGFGTVTYGKRVPGVQGPMGEPGVAVRSAMPTSGVRQAGGSNTLLGNGPTIRQAQFDPSVAGPADGCTNCTVPGVGGNMIRDGYGPPPGYGATGPYGPQRTPYGPQMPNMPRHGIVPVPGQGVPGAVAGLGAMVPGMGGMGAGRPGMANGRSSINFTGPAGMKVTWQLPDGSFNDEANALTAPKEYNFLQGQVYRLRLTQILPDFPGRAFYPTLEIAPASPKSLVFLSHSSVPITFTADDFAQAKAGNLVVKVVYLPDPINQDFSLVVGAEEVVSTRLEPGADPVAEAQRRGTILAVIRMGNIDLENRVSPAMTAPPPGMVPVPRMRGNGDLSPLAPPLNPPGTATVRPPATLPALPMAPVAPVEPDEKLPVVLPPIKP